MTLTVMPDFRACISQWLRDQDELSELIGDRLYGELNLHRGAHEYPMGRITQIGDRELVSGTHAAVWCVFQFDWWGGDPSLTWRCAETTRALLKQRLTGTHDMPAGGFIAGHVVAGGIRRSTEPLVSAGTEGDAEARRARPRCTHDVSMMLRPARTVGS